MDRWNCTHVSCWELPLPPPVTTPASATGGPTAESSRFPPEAPDESHRGDGCGVRLSTHNDEIDEDDAKG